VRLANIITLLETIAMIGSDASPWAEDLAFAVALIWRFVQEDIECLCRRYAADLTRSDSENLRLRSFGDLRRTILSFIAPAHQLA